MKSANHNIQKVFLEVNTQTSKKAYYLKDTIDDFLKEHLFPFIENYLNSLELDANINFQLENLQLSLSVKEDMKIEDMIPKIKKQLDQVFFSEKSNLITSETTGSFKKINKSENNVNTLLYFLENGNYPWWVENVNHPNQSVEALLYECIESPVFIKAFKQKMGSPVFRKRTIFQVSDLFLSLLVLKISSGTKKSTLSFIKSKQFLNDISKVSKKLKLSIWDLLIDFSLGNKTSSENLEQTYFESINKISTKNEIEKISLNNILEKGKKGKIIKKFSFDSTKINNLETIDTEDSNDSILEKKPSHNKNKNDSSYSELSKESDINNVKDEISTSKQEDLNNLSEKENTASLNQKEDKLKSKSAYNSDSKESNKSLAIENTTIYQEDEIIKQEGVYYVENAGLILLHPFLKSFFEKCSLLDDNQNINNPILAIHLLHYLATGQEKQYEHLQILEKFLCAIPLQHPINREVYLSDKLKENAEELLEAVLKHLPMLKSTSAELFQNEFLQRPGKLLLEKNTTKLIIEQKTQDLLLKSIPWNISVVKLPWHKRIFFVDW